MHDPHAAIRDELFRQVLDGLGESESALRRSAAENVTVPPDLQPLVDKIHAHAYRVTDDDVARAQAVYGDDKLIVIRAMRGHAPGVVRTLFYRKDFFGRTFSELTHQVIEARRPGRWVSASSSRRSCRGSTSASSEPARTPRSRRRRSKTVRRGSCSPII